MTNFTQQDFRQALGQYATGITIVTTRDSDNTPIGMTANSFVSVSLDPPLVLWSVDNSSPLYAGFAAASHYAVHILDEAQQSLSNRFADDDVDKFEGLNISSGINDLPLLEQHIARLQCEVVDRHEAGDHMILIGHVLDIQHESKDPLLFFSGDYRRLQA